MVDGEDEPRDRVDSWMMESTDCVCVVATDDEERLRQFSALLHRAGIATTVQTITVRDHGREPRTVFLIYVPACVEQRAMLLVDHSPGRPLFPLAHLRSLGSPTSDATASTLHHPAE